MYYYALQRGPAVGLREACIRWRQWHQFPVRKRSKPGRTGHRANWALGVQGRGNGHRSNETGSAGQLMCSRPTEPALNMLHGRKGVTPIGLLAPHIRGPFFDAEYCCMWFLFAEFVKSTLFELVALSHRCYRTGNRGGGTGRPQVMAGDLPGRHAPGLEASPANQAKQGTKTPNGNPTRVANYK